MRRFVTYIYEYERGARGRNVGFIRTDIREDCCRMEVHIRGLNRFQGKGQVYLLADADNPIGISAGELLLSQGMGHLKLTCPQNQLGKSGYSVSQLLAFVVRYGNGRLLVGSFATELPAHILQGEFELWSADASMAKNPVPEEVSENVSLHMAADIAVDSMAKNSTSEEVSENVSLHMAAGNTVDSMAKNPAVEEVSGDDTQVQYEQIEITDIRRLPKRNWHLCNNSFLVHGFFNYHHLILKTVQTGDQIQRFLGVPGIYEQRERMMALLFGFPEFEAASSPSAASAQASDNGTFGYWMCELYEPA